jgi:hypothetical protein
LSAAGYYWQTQVQLGAVSTTVGFGVGATQWFTCNIQCALSVRSAWIAIGALCPCGGEPAKYSGLAWELHVPAATA